MTNQFVFTLSENKLLRTSNLDTLNPIWETVASVSETPFAPASSQFTDFAMDPFSPSLTGAGEEVGVYLLSNKGLWYCANAGAASPVWTLKKSLSKKFSIVRAVPGVEGGVAIYSNPSTFEETIIPAYASDASGSFPGYSHEKVYDGIVDGTGESYWKSNDNSPIHWLEFTTEPARITSYAVTARDSNSAPTWFELQVKLGETWTTIHSREGMSWNSHERKEYNISNPVIGAEWRLIIHATPTGWAEIAEWELYGNFSNILFSSNISDGKMSIGEGFLDGEPVPSAQIVGGAARSTARRYYGFLDKHQEVQMYYDFPQPSRVTFAKIRARTHNRYSALGMEIYVGVHKIGDPPNAWALWNAPNSGGVFDWDVALDNWGTFQYRWTGNVTDPQLNWQFDKLYVHLLLRGDAGVDWGEIDDVVIYGESYQSGAATVGFSNDYGTTMVFHSFGAGASSGTGMDVDDHNAGIIRAAGNDGLVYETQNGYGSPLVAIEDSGIGGSAINGVQVWRKRLDGNKNAELGQLHGHVSFVTNTSHRSSVERTQNDFAGYAEIDFSPYDGQHRYVAAGPYAYEVNAAQPNRAIFTGYAEPTPGGQPGQTKVFQVRLGDDGQAAYTPSQTNLAFRAVSFDKLSRDVVYAAGADGVGVSSDGGATFVSKNGTGGTALPSANYLKVVAVPGYQSVCSSHEAPTEGICIIQSVCEPTSAGVDVRTGDKVLVQKDLTVKTQDGELAFIRSYKTSKRNNAHFQGMGMGWTHNHAGKLTINGTSPNRLIEILLPSAGKLLMEETGLNQFKAKPGATADLVINAGNYLLTLQDKSTYTFSSAGLLSARGWPNGDAWTYAYDGNNRLESVTDGQGHALYFSYRNSPGQPGHEKLWRVGDQTASGLSTTTPSGRYIELNYAAQVGAGSGALLTSVQDVRGQAWSYGYYGQQGGETETLLFNRLVERRSPQVDTDGDGLPNSALVLERLVYTVSGGQVTGLSQEQGNGQQVTAYTFPTSSNRVGLETTAGQVTSHVFAQTGSGLGIYQGARNANDEGGERKLDSNYRPVVQTDANGNATFMKWSADGKQLTQVLDAAGHTTQFAYDEEERLIQSQDAEGRLTLYGYAPSDTPSRQPALVLVADGKNLIIDGDLEQTSGWSGMSGAAPQVNTRSNVQKYTGQFSRLVQANSAGQGIESNSWSPVVGAATYTVIARIFPVSGTVKLRVSSTSDFDAITTQTGAWQTLVAVHDGSQLSASNTLQLVAHNGAAQFYVDSVWVIAGEVLQWQEFTYDSQARLLTEQTFDPSDGTTMLRKVTRTYYTSGNGAGLLQSVTQKDLVGSDDQTTTYLYDSAGRVSQTNQNSNFGSCTRSRSIYDASGNVVASICNYDPEASGVTSFDANTPPTTAAEAVLLRQETVVDELNKVTTYEYDALGRRMKTTIQAGEVDAQTSLTVYDAFGRVIRTITNFDGTGVSQPYTAPRSAFSHGADNTKNFITEMVYNERGQVRKQTDVLGRVTLYGYNAVGQLIKTIQNASQPMYNNTYGIGGDPSLANYVTSSAADEDFITTSNQTYDANGNLVRSVDVLGRVTFTVYDALNRPIKTVRSAKAEATIALQPGDAAYTVANDPRSSLYVPSTAPDRDLVTTTTYDQMGRVIQSADVLGNVTLYGYDHLGRQVKTIQNASHPTYPVLADSDLSDYLMSQRSDEDIVSLTSYDAAGRAFLNADVNGRQSRAVYDGLGRQVKTVADYLPLTGMNANPASWVWDAGQSRWEDGNNIPLPAGETWIWDAGQTRWEDPNGSPIDGLANQDTNLVSQTAYDSEGRVKWTLDSVGRYTLFGYDDFNRRVRVIRNAQNPAYNTALDPDLSGYSLSTASDEDLLTETAYDPRGRVALTIDARGNRTFFVYDSLGRQVKTVRHAKPTATVSLNPGDVGYSAANDPRSASYVRDTAADRDLITQTAYDLAGRVSRTIDPAGLKTDFVYDGLNRRIKTITNFVDGVYQAAAPDEDLISQTLYNRQGQVVATVDARQTRTEFTYDGLGRRLTVIRAATTSLAIADYTCYDKAGRVLRQIRGWQTTANQPSADARDAQGHWLFAPVPTGQADQNLVTTYTLDRLGRQVRVKDPMGHETRMVYRKDGQLDWLVDAEGSLTKYVYDRLGRLIRTIQGYRPVQSATLKALAFTSVPYPSEFGAYPCQPNNTGQIYLLKPDGTGRTLLSDPCFAGQGFPSWSPDGSQLALEVNFGNVAWELHRMNADGTNRTLVTPLAYTSVSTWSPDGSWLLFTDRVANGSLGLYVIRPDGSQRHLLHHDPNYDAITPSWSPDGTRIAFTKQRLDNSGGDVFVMNMDGTEPIQLTSQPTARNFWPVWSPDGGHLLFQAMNGAYRDIFRIKVDGTGLTNLTNNALGEDRTAYYAPDGQRIVFGSTRDGNRELYRMEADGSNQTRLTFTSPVVEVPETGNELEPRWSWQVIDPAEWVWNTGALRWEDGQGTPIPHGDNWYWNATLSRWEDAVGAPIPANANQDRNLIVDVTYDRAGHRLMQRDPRGAVTTYTYDQLDRRTALINPLSQTWETAYEDISSGSKVTLSDPMGFETERLFDHLGRLTGINYLSESPKYTPDVIFAYDLQGNRTRMTEKVGLATVRETHYGYDDVRRLTQVGFDTNGDSTIEQAVSYKYDAGGLRTEMELPGGLKITYAYDARGQLVSLKDWDNQVQRYYHDRLGRLRSLLRSNGVETGYQYDGSGRLLDLHHRQASRTLHRLLYQVDGRGNRTQMQEITPAATPINATILSSDARVAYYRGQWQTNGSYRVTSNLRAALRLALVGQQIQVTLGTGPNNGICDIYLDDTFWGSRDTYAPTSGEETFTLDAYLDGAHVLEIRQHAEKNLASTGYTLSFKQVVVTTAYATQTVQYAYDQVSRLLQANYHDSASVVGTPFRQYGYTYDRAGNRLTNKVWLEGVLDTNLTYTYNMANQLTSDGTKTFTWDANGNLTGDGTQTYAWDRANRLRQMFDGTDTYAYTYNGFGQRIQQTLNPSSSNVITQYLLDVQPGLYKVIASTVGANTTRYIHDPRGIFAQENPNGDWRWMLNDGLGSVRDVVNNSADVLASTQYAPYGEIWDTTGTAQTNFGFTGEPTHGNDLVHLRARHYHPILGNFVSLDALETLNRFVYANGNPVNLVDPSGRLCVPNLNSRMSHDKWGKLLDLYGPFIHKRTANQNLIDNEDGWTGDNTSDYERGRGEFAWDYRRFIDISRYDQLGFFDEDELIPQTIERISDGTKMTLYSHTLAEVSNSGLIGFSTANRDIYEEMLRLSPPDFSRAIQNVLNSVGNSREKSWLTTSLYEGNTDLKPNPPHWDIVFNIPNNGLLGQYFSTYFAVDRSDLFQSESCMVRIGGNCCNFGTYDAIGIALDIWNIVKIVIPKLVGDIALPIDPLTIVGCLNSWVGTVDSLRNDPDPETAILSFITVVINCAINPYIEVALPFEEIETAVKVAIESAPSVADIGVTIANACH